MKEYDIQLLNDIISYNKLRYFSYKNGVYIEENLKYERILKSRYMKVSRLNRRFIYLLSRFDYIWFCTFTFNNDLIDKTTRTKRDTIRKVLDTYDFKYILNIDYGKKNEREHYHCILGTNFNIDVNKYFQDNYDKREIPKNYRQSFCYSKLCQLDTITDFTKLSKYVNKLCNHCLKSTTKQQRIYYNFKGFDIFEPRLATFYYHFERDYLFQLD